jgi:hypothetical protein
MSRSAQAVRAMKNRYTGACRTVTGLLDFALGLQREYEEQTSIEERKTKGQYFTAPEVCKFMAGLFSTPARSSFRLLDPGAGVGSLTAAVCERLLSAERPYDMYSANPTRIAFGFPGSARAFRFYPLDVGELRI